MTGSDKLIKGGIIITPGGRFAADIAVRDGVIRAIGRDLGVLGGLDVIDVTGLAVMPGVIDPHSHLWEAGFMSGPDFADSTASAAAGGITTVIDMPLTVPEVLDADLLREKAALGQRTSHVDFALHGGVSPDRLADLEGQWRAGCTAFKIFTCDTGCAMAGVIEDADLLEALTIIGSFGGLATFHAENEELLVSNLARLKAEGRTDNRTFTAWRNETVELEAINRILFYAGRTGARVNIVHVTSPEGVAMVRRARALGVDATAETCPHYLYLTDDDIAERGAWVTCAPPMRGRDAMEGMRDLVAGGDILTVGSDHGPVDPALKERGSNNILNGQPGMPGNETMVPLMLNLVAEGRLTLERLAELSAAAPARLYGLYPRKGAIVVGSDADFTIVDPDHAWTISQAGLIGKSGWTPYEGLAVRGRVAKTIIRGRVAAENGRIVSETGHAAFIPRAGSAAAQGG
jgi:allantoinase